ncbi:non-specific lipid-transfer protein-like protein At2g13820 isoform X2 [Papaver somniferum]|uniref:non-specific lipid-transfer protein-like protein At2g13820 isoform X2 n=1 Tax=Papaver somniferum TaxID=3469 RepID=UPI000E6FD39E|nr:non-specific lipid-transfer protein-like protein At2g13820 isoform X2 [Papaver somniferum]
MAFKGIQVCSVALLTALLFAVAANAQSDCTNVIISLSPCLNYLTGNSSTPSSDCCSQLSTVVRSKPECLCQVLNGDDSSLAGLNIKKTQALGLPKACNVQTPSISKCNSGSPSGSPSDTPDSPTTPASGGGSKTTPSNDGDSSHATSTTIQFYVLIMSLLVASFAST